MESVIFEIDRTKQEEYTFDDLNEATKKAFADADTGKTHKSYNMEDLFEQLGI